MYDSPYFRKPIFVTGLPRSGTSMVAGCLHLSGAWVGNTVAGGVGNEKGFFENIALREQIIKGLLTALGCDPLGVKSLPQFDQVPNVRGLLEGFVHFLQRDGYDGQQPWLFKDAKLTLLWPLIAPIFPEARWVIVRRDPQAIINSCMRTHFMAHHSQSLAFWQDFVNQYQARLSALLNSCFKVTEISADNLVNGNSDELLSLAETLELSADLSTMKQFISPGLWRAQTPA